MKPVKITIYVNPAFNYSRSNEDYCLNSVMSRDGVVLNSENRQYKCLGLTDGEGEHRLFINVCRAIHSRPY